MSRVPRRAGGDESRVTARIVSRARPARETMRVQLGGVVAVIMSLPGNELIYEAESGSVAGD